MSYSYHPDIAARTPTLDPRRQSLVDALVNLGVILKDAASIKGAESKQYYYEVRSFHLYEENVLIMIN